MCNDYVRKLRNEFNDNVMNYVLGTGEFLTRGPSGFPQSGLDTKENRQVDPIDRDETNRIRGHYKV